MKNIKEVSKLLKISSRTIRYYEEIGLITSVKNNNIRFFEEAEYDKIIMIINLRKIDISLAKIKELFNQFDRNKIIEIIQDKQNECYELIKNTSKKLLIISNIEKTIDITNINNVILNETSKLLNIDEIRKNIVIEFINKIINNDFINIVNLLDEKMNINILKTEFAEKLDLIGNKVDYVVYSHLSYYNNTLYLQLNMKKKYLIKFVFNDDNLIIGIWLEKMW